MFSIDTIFEQTILGNKVENLLWFFGILLVGLSFLRLLSKIFSRLFYKVFKRFSTEITSESFVELHLKPIQTVVLILIIYAAINRLDYPLHEVFFKRKNTEILFIELIDKIFLFAFIVSLFWVMLRTIDFIAIVFSYRASLTKSKSDDQIVPFVKELAKIVLIIIAVFVILGFVLEINVLTLITGLGIGGIALALAAKESLENLLASFIIFFDKPFVVGDLIRIENIEGTVEKVGFRSSHIKTSDTSIVTVPNRKMIDNYLENLTLRNYRRVKFIIGLSYDTKTETLRKIVDEINLLITSQTYTNKEGIAIFQEFGDSSLNITIQYFIEMMEYNTYLKYKEELNFKILDSVYKNGASLAFPTRTIIYKHTNNTQADPPVDY